MAGQMHNGLAARDKGLPAALPCVGAGNASQKAAGLPGLTAKAVCQQNRLVPFGAAGVRSVRELCRAAADACRMEHVISESSFRHLKQNMDKKK